MAVIDIGSVAIYGTHYYIDTNYTRINKVNPANANGKITSVEIYAHSAMTGLEVGIFYVVSGNNLTCRSYTAIGNVGAGYSQHNVNIDVEAGDFIGFYCASGLIRLNTGTYPGNWQIVGDYIPCTNTVFANSPTTIPMSLYGTGITVPAQVTGVSATDGTYTDKVTVTWSAASEATKYYVWTGSSWIDVGNVTTYDHTTAPAPTITAGTASASDGTSQDYVTLSIAGESANNGSPIIYKVKAWNVAGYGAESATNSGYRGVGNLTYQWQRSSADSDANYSNINGATTDPYNDTGAPEDGSGRYYKCVEDATGATQQTSTVNRGYRSIFVPPTYNYFGYNASS